MQIKKKRKKPLAVSGSQWPETLVGGKYIRMLERHLHTLRATEFRDQSGGREGAIVLLLTFINIMIA